MDSKVVIEKALLAGSRHYDMSQLVATVYKDGYEYRVYAPPKATGHVADWLRHLSVRSPSTSPWAEGELHIDDNEIAGQIISLVDAELKRKALDSDIWSFGSDGRFYPALICLHGHVIHVDGKDLLKTDRSKKEEHCETCGSKCIRACMHCEAPIRGKGVGAMSRGDYAVPAFCYNCGRAYPWMEDRLETARDLLWHDDKLTLEDREKLWGLLQYVMSDPKSDLVPAKKKLIAINLGKAASATRDFVLEFLAKYAAEMSKP